MLFAMAIARFHRTFYLQPSSSSEGNEGITSLAMEDTVRPLPCRSFEFLLSIRISLLNVHELFFDIKLNTGFSFFPDFNSSDMPNLNNEEIVGLFSCSVIFAIRKPLFPDKALVNDGITLTGIFGVPSSSPVLPVSAEAVSNSFCDLLRGSLRNVNFILLFWFVRQIFPTNFLRCLSILEPPSKENAHQVAIDHA